MPRVSIQHRTENDKFPSDDMWLAWMERNPQETKDLLDKGHEDVVQLVIQEYNKSRRSGFLGPDYWTFKLDED